jgi:Flp pilus assembly pilin Flp
MIKTPKGQLSIEFAIILFVVVVALLAIQGYFKRALQGRWKQAADSIGEQYSFENTISNITLVINSTSTTITNTTEKEGITNTTTRTDFKEAQRQWGYENVTGW